MQVARKAYKELYFSAVSVQAGMRGMAARNVLRFKRQTKAAIVIQVRQVFMMLKVFLKCQCQLYCNLLWRWLDDYTRFNYYIYFLFFMYLLPNFDYLLPFAEPMSQILSTPAFYGDKESSNYHTMCMERKSCS